MPFKNTVASVHQQLRSVPPCGSSPSAILRQYASSRMEARRATNPFPYPSVEDQYWNEVASPTSSEQCYSDECPSFSSEEECSPVPSRSGSLSSTTSLLPLCSTWTLWRSQWHQTDDSSSGLGSCNDIPSFWALFNSVPANDRTALPFNASLQLFRDHIKPKWEDSGNVTGGHFKITLSSKADVLTVWRELAMLMIGESWQHSSHVCGGSIDVKPKKANSGTLWLNTTDPSVLSDCRHLLLSLFPEDWITSSKFVVHKVLLKNYHETQKKDNRKPKTGGKKGSHKTAKTGQQSTPKNQTQPYCHSPYSYN